MFTVLLALFWIFSLFSAGHALLTKRDPRAALGWIVTCLALPGVGALAYWVLGVNRIRTRARVSFDSPASHPLIAQRQPPRRP